MMQYRSENDDLAFVLQEANEGICTDFTSTTLFVTTWTMAKTSHNHFHFCSNKAISRLFGSLTRRTRPAHSTSIFQLWKEPPHNYATIRSQIHTRRYAHKRERVLGVTHCFYTEFTHAVKRKKRREKNKPTAFSVWDTRLHLSKDWKRMGLWNVAQPFEWEKDNAVGGLGISQQSTFFLLMRARNFSSACRRAN